MYIQADIHSYLSAYASGQPATVDQKDALATLAATSTTIAGFALVFLGIIITRPAKTSKLRSEIRIIASWILIFWLLALSAFCALAWLYFSAPGSIHIPLFGKTGLGVLYQSSWALLLLTAAIAIYAVVVTIRIVIGDSNRPTDG